MTLRAIDPAPHRARYAGGSSEVGERPELQWVKIDRLRIDPRYQREIGQRGANNILRIATAFQWAKFAPVVAASIGGGLFAIVDGQHRTTAASLRGFESVPCVIISADEAEQADAFVAINSNVTAMSSLQLHAARLAAGDKSTVDLAHACSEADVTICRYPVPADKMKPGETLAAALLQGLLKKYGREILVSALSCITKTRKGNPGMIRRQIVEALCVELEAKDMWNRDRARLIFAMQTFDFSAEYTKAIRSGEKVSSVLVKAIDAHLESKMAGAPDGQKNQEAEERQIPAAKPLAQQAAPLKASIGHGLTIGREYVAFRGNRINVSPRAAILVTTLAKAKPNPVGDNFLIAKMWTVRPGNAGDLLESIVLSLATLKQIGLEVRSLRGVGRQLVEIKA